MTNQIFYPVRNKFLSGANGVKKIFSLKKTKGIALILTIMVMALILFLALYVLSSALTESRIAKSQSWSAKTYYLAETGMQDMIWKLKNDAAYKTNFETDADWTASFTRTDPFGASSGSYTVSLVNSSLAHGEITASSSISLGGGKYSQRIIKTKIYKAISDSFLGNITGYGDHDMEISNSVLNIYNGGIHANHDFKAKNSSTIYIEKDLSVVHDYTKDINATVTIGGDTYSRQNPPAPDTMDMPAVDFDSGQPTSYKNKADIIYDEDDFEDLMEDNQTLTLNNDITYVDKDVELKGGQNLIINGLLVIEHDLEIGDDRCWGSRCGYSTITVNNTPGKASGILVKHKIEFKEWTGDVNVSGLIYASQDLKIDNLPIAYDFNVSGAMIGGHNFDINGTTRPINITKNDETFVGVIGSAEFSPIIMVEHWEEEY